MSGNYFDVSFWTLNQAAEDLHHFVNKQLLYHNNQINPNLPTGDWDHELSAHTLSRIKIAADTLKKAALMYRQVDLLLASDISESSFNEDWELQENN